MVRSSEKPASTQVVSRIPRMYSSKCAELYADGNTCSKVSSSGLGLNASIQSEGLATRRHASPTHFRCATGQRSSRHMSSSSRHVIMTRPPSMLAGLQSSCRSQHTSMAGEVEGAELRDMR